MNRRKFLWTVAGAAAGAGLLPRSVGAQAGNPKVFLFGMIVIDDANGLAAVFPQIAGMAPHQAFLAASGAQIKALKGTAVSLAKSGIEQVHRDFLATVPSPWAWCLNNQPLTVGTGPASIQQGLRDRLPSLSKLGSEPTIRRQVAATSLPPGSFALTLGGGTLRLPKQRSTSIGTDPSVLWQFRNGSTPLGQPMSLTDLAVFESATPRLEISGHNGGTLALGPGDVVWFFNLPINPGKDTTATQIEHAAVAFSLLTPALTSNSVTATTTSNLRFPGTGKQFAHPCASTPPAPVRTPPHATGGSGRVSIFYAPPDSDPCFISTM